MTKQLAKSMRDNPWMRWGALVLLSLTMFFGYMFVDVLSPIKSQLEGAIGWSDTTFGFYAGSEFFLNVAGFLILAGIILDKIGVRSTALLSGSLMVIGALIKVYGLSEGFAAGGIGYDLMNSFWPNLPASAKMSALGFMIFGCGTEMAGVTVSRAIVKWFQGKELALAMGIEMAIARLGVATIFWISPWLSERFGSVSAPVIFCTILLCIGLVLYIIYGIMDKALDKEGTATEEEEDPFRFSDLGKVFGSSAFWVVALLCVLFYSAIFPFQKYAAEMLQNKVGFELEYATGLFSLFPIGAMIVTPILGTYLDRVGKGATMLIIGSVMMVVSHSIFALYPFAGGTSLDTAVALSAIIVLGISFSLVPATLCPSVPKLIDGKVLGSAYSAIFWIQNVGLMSVPYIIGLILNATNQGIAEGAPKDYTLAMLVFASFGVLAFVMAFILKAMDKKKGFGLEEPNVKKK